MNKTQYYLRYSLGGLDMILITNIILKYFNLINWSWKKTLWPLWVDITMATLIWCWKTIRKNKNE